MFDVLGELLATVKIEIESFLTSHFSWWMDFLLLSGDSLFRMKTLAKPAHMNLPLAGKIVL